ncbi:MAG: hypothetical protein ACW99G_00340 [Candidatus Thorarchaeota archaeon]|jgi:hypothetical protein
MNNFILWLEHKLEQQVEEIVNIILENDLDGYEVFEQYSLDDPRDFLGSKDFYKQMGHKVKDIPKQTIASMPKGGSLMGTDAAKSIDTAMDAIKNTLAQRQKIDANLGSSIRQLNRVRQNHMSSGLDRVVNQMIKTRDTLHKAFTNAFKNKLSKAHMGLTTAKDELDHAHQQATRKVTPGYSPDMGERTPEVNHIEVGAYQKAKDLADRDWKTKSGKPAAKSTIKRAKQILAKGVPLGAEGSPTTSPEEVSQFLKKIGDEREFSELPPDDQRRMMMSIGLPSLPEKIKKYGLHKALQMQDPEMKPGMQVTGSEPSRGDLGMSDERLARAKRMGSQMAAGLPATDDPDELEMAAAGNKDLKQQIKDVRKKHYGPGFKGWLRRMAAGPGLPPGYEVDYK